MKGKRIIAAGLVIVGAGVLYLIQRRQVYAEITPRPIFYLLADTQRELERVPLRLTRVSEQEENQIGQELARSYGWTPAKHSEPDAQRIAAYVQQVGQRVAAQAERKGIRYRFFLKDDDYFVNAGALPGGQVVIGRGMIELMQSEDELAYVLGHEIAHVDRRHAIERFQYEMKSKQLGMRGIYRLVEFGVKLYQMGYTKEQEEEADLKGLELMVKAAYSPAGALEFERRMEIIRGGGPRPAESPVEEILRVPVQSLGEYFRSHPTMRRRVNLVEKEIAARGWDPAQAQKPLAVRNILLAEQAENLDKRGLFDRAIARYEEALRMDSTSAPTWKKLAEVKWRSGDAKGSAEAAKECIWRDVNQTAAWELLAKALAASERETALASFDKIAGVSPSSAVHTQAMIAVERAGLAYKKGGKGVPRELDRWLSPGVPVATQVKIRQRLAWWMYRAGDLEAAQNQLEIAYQMYPTDKQTSHELAWVQSDLGKQASAQENLRIAGSVPSGSADCALESLILWRMEKKKEAEETFRRAAEGDPVWMVERWVANNYSAEAATDLSKLRTAELGRRRQEEIRAGRTPSSSATKPNLQ